MIDIHAAWSGNEWPLHPFHDLPSQSLQGDPNIDDPVNDTGLGPWRSDFQVSGEFAS
jgi:hypothetical protein